MTSLKSFASYVLQQIFSGETKDEVVERIHHYLTKVAEEVRQNLIPIEKFVINKVFQLFLHQSLINFI